ncbi:MAG: ceramidase domain-containing protein [Pyrinomonadaceae bacterium]
MIEKTTSEFDWRRVVILAVLLGSLALIILFAPREQVLSYHAFADNRSFFSVPNFFDVVSNFTFLIVGLLGLNHCFKTRPGNLKYAWFFLFAGVTLVSVGSAYYHWEPNNESLVWDRLPMTVGFMGLFAALIGEYVSEQLGRILLIPLVLFGMVSVTYWHWSGDLRVYIWVQAVPLITIPVLFLLYRSRYTHQWLLLLALGLYALAKVTELYDLEIFEASGRWISGHTIKHILSAAGCAAILVMLRLRRLTSPRDVTR